MIITVGTLGVLVRYLYIRSCIDRTRAMGRYPLLGCRFRFCLAGAFCCAAAMSYPHGWRKKKKRLRQQIFFPLSHWSSAPGNTAAAASDWVKVSRRAAI